MALAVAASEVSGRARRLDGEKATLALLLLAAGLIHLPAALYAGFLSDDFSFRARAGASASIWLPFESHHLAPLAHALWRAAARGWLDAVGFHLLLLAVHLANVALLWRVARATFAVSAPVALVGAALFALSPAGLEAFHWCGSGAYVLVACPVLAALARVPAPGETPHVSRTATVFAALQLLAVAAFDHGALLFPTLLVLCLWRQPPRVALRLVWPAGVVWLAYLVVRAALDVRVGYGLLNPVDRVALALATAPVATLWEGTGWRGGVAALALLAMRTTRPAVGVPWALATAWLLPFALLGALDSRYLYLPGAMLALAAAAASELPRWRAVSAVAWAGVLAFQLQWTLVRVGHYVEAGRAARSVEQQLAAVAARAYRPLVVANLPDHIPSGRTIIPVWRNGSSEIGVRFVPIATAGRPRPAGSWRVLSRCEVPAAYPDSDLHEFVPGWRLERFVLIPFRAARCPP